MSEETALMPVAPQGPLATADVVRQVALIQEVMAAVMKSGEHYGTIPGCGNKPTLLLPGAQKLLMVFRLAPRFTRERVDHPGGHREYITKCEIASIATGEIVGEASGSCSTMESKYRYRNASDYALTGEPIPEDYKERKAEYRKQGLTAKKIDGEWEWVRFTDAGKVENPDIADVYNTVLKMSDKRALIAATLIALAASDIFTQDIEDLTEAAAIVKASAETMAELQRLATEELGYKLVDLKKTVKRRYQHSKIEDLTEDEAGQMLAGFRIAIEAKAEEATPEEEVERAAAEAALDPDAEEVQF